MSGIGHSKLVAMAKRILPLIALGLLATLFLMRGERELENELTFSDEEVEAAGDGIAITGPSISGESQDGVLFDFRASEVRPGGTSDVSQTGMSSGDSATVSNFIGTLDQPGGQGLRMEAIAAELAEGGTIVRLPQSVNISTTDGFDLNADTAIANANEGSVSLSGTVEAAGPMGRIRADNAEIKHDGTSMTVTFRDRVRLVYDPAKPGVE
ncbi:hypothetical protein ACMA5I_01140 [Paracoccaceae bacterium GXU_MW_L88]